MDAFLDININSENLKESEDLANIIKQNANLIADWDIDGGWGDEDDEDDTAIISIQFLSFDKLSEFVKVLKENGYEL
jgi:hypothetical protein